MYQSDHKSSIVYLLESLESFEIPLDKSFAYISRSMMYYRRDKRQGKKVNVKSEISYVRGVKHRFCHSDVADVLRSPNGIHDPKLRKLGAHVVRLYMRLIGCFADVRIGACSILFGSVYSEIHCG